MRDLRAEPDDGTLGDDVFVADGGHISTGRLVQPLVEASGRRCAAGPGAVLRAEFDRLGAVELPT